MVLMVVVVMMEVVMMMRSRVERRGKCKKSWVQCNLQRRKGKTGKRERDIGEEGESYFPSQQLDQIEWALGTTQDELLSTQILK